MKVFVWVDQNSTSVYKADTFEDLTKLVSQINDVLKIVGDAPWTLDANASSLPIEKVCRSLQLRVSNMIDVDDSVFSFGSEFTEVI